jgi:hypothetical protein
MNSTAHTPTPWVVCENDPADSMDYDKIWVTTDDRLYKSLVPIAEVGIDYSEPINSEQKANAEFIVRAVNFHDEMLAALKAAEGLIAGTSATGNELSLIRATIAKAESCTS